MKHPDARTLHAEGVSYLVLGQSLAAVEKLESALAKEQRPDPQLLSDLAAAYLAAGQAEKALQIAERAWHLARTPEIAWNRAFAAQQMKNRNLAISAWNDYLSLNDSPDWTAEAKKHLAEVQSK